MCEISTAKIVALWPVAANDLGHGGNDREPALLALRFVDELELGSRDKFLKFLDFLGHFITG